MSTRLAELRRLRRQAGGGATRMTPPPVPHAPVVARAGLLPTTASVADGCARGAGPGVADAADMARVAIAANAVRGIGAAFGHAAAEPAPVLRRPADVAALRHLLRVRAIAAPAVEAGGRDLPGSEIAPGLRLVAARLRVPPLPDSLDGTFDRRDAFDPRDVLFFDTETTGLAGGSGTRAFMIGAARWSGDGLETRQLFITNLAAEAVMLAEFARWLAAGTILVSFNGKSYDAPLLRTRWRLARQDDPLAGLAHIDLLHAARRRYRGQFENCRLQTIERRVLGIVREDDLPGSEAPAAWLGYLRGGSSAKLNRVTAHNRQDVVTLARLLRHLAA